MLITTTRTLENNVHKAVVESEPNTLDRSYMKAYGEPKVSSGGVLAYPDSTRTPQSVTTGDAVYGTVADIPGSRTIVTFRAGAINLAQVRVGDQLTFSDVLLEPTLNGTFPVVAVDEIHNAVAIAATGIPTNSPFSVDVNEGLVAVGAQIEGQALSGFTDSGVELVLQFKASTGFDFSLITPVTDSITISGVTLEPGLNGTFPITAVSIANKTVSIDTQGLVSQPQFEVPTPSGDMAHILSPVQFTAPAQEVYICSSSPFEFKLSQTTDPAAGAKVKAWADDLKNKISAATLSLKALPNPTTSYPIVESTEVV
jgi:hypothetical protein